MSEDATEAVESEEVTPPADDATETDKSESPSATAKAEAAAESPSGDAEADGESEPKEWVNLVSKYDGDKAKIGEEFWRATKANAELAKKVKELEAKVATPVAPKPEDQKPAEKPAADHPSIQKLESTITALEAETSTLSTQGSTKYAELQTQDKAILKLEARIEDQGELADDALKQRLELAKDRRENLATQLESLADRFKNKQERLEDLKGKREAVRAEADNESKRQAEQQQKDAEFSKEFPQEVDALIAQAADEIGLPQDDEIRQDLWETANTKLMAYLFKLGKGVILPDVDLKQVVHGYVERFAKTHGFASKTKFAETSREKAKVASRKITPGQPLVTKKAPTPSPWLVDDAVAKDSKLMAARARLAARLGPNA
jgi:hypothetical protein